MFKRIIKIFKISLISVLSLMLIISALLIIFKDDIRSYAIKEINTHLNKKVHVSFIDVGLWKTFPELSLEFDNVLIRDKFDTLQKIDTCMYAQKISLRFNPLDLLKSNYSVNSAIIDKGKINLRVNEKGIVNYDLVKPSETTEESNFKFSLESIKVRNTSFSYANEITKQYHSAKFNKLLLNGEFTSNQYLLSAESDFRIQSLRSDAVTLVTNKDATCAIDISIDNEKNEFEIVKADIKIQHLPFYLTGKVTDKLLNFKLEATQLNLEEVANNLSMSQLNTVKKLHGKGLVDFTLVVAGENKKDVAPTVNADFSVTNGALRHDSFNLTDINVNGNYTNVNHKDVLNLKRLKFLSSGSKFSGNLRVTHFDKPIFKGKAKGIINLSAIHHLFGPFGMQELKGNLDINSSFNIRMNNPVYKPKDLKISSLVGNVKMKNLRAQFLNDKRVFSNLNGEIVVKNQKAGLKDVTLLVGTSDLKLNGTLNNIANYFKGEGILSVDASLISNKINVYDLSPEEDIKSTARAWVLPTQVKGNVLLNTKEINYGGHTYSDISTKLTLAHRMLKFSRLKGTNAGCKITGNILIKETSPSLLTVSTDIKSNNIEFTQLFSEWNNFEQDMITSNNIAGVAKVKLKFSAPFDLITGIKMEGIASKINLEINNGALKNVTTFKEITKSIKSSGGKLVLSNSKINNFEQKLLNLQFKTLKNELIIKNGELIIPEMTIENNALSVVLSGSHKFNDDIDYHFDFRFRELKGGNRQTEFGEVQDDGSGFRVYLRMFGNLSNPSYQWDKEAKKQDKKQEREAAVNEAKSILKAGFGLMKNDTTVSTYQEKEKPKEELIIDFGKDTLVDEHVTKKEGRIKKWTNALKKQVETEEKEKEKFVIDE